MESNPIHNTFTAERFHSAKAILSISDSSGIVWMEGLSDIGSESMCDESGIV